ncbi:MAG: insulinase family protein [Planctomycetota bacterium]
MIVRAIFRVLDDVKRTIGAGAIASATRRIGAALSLETDSPVEIAHELAFWTGLGGLEVRDSVVTALRGVGREDVRSLLEGMSPERAAVGILLPEEGSGTPASAGGRTPRPAAARGRSSASAQECPATWRPAPEVPIDAGVSFGRASAPRVETLALGRAGRAIVDARPDLDTFVLKAALADGRHAVGAPATAALLRGFAEALAGDRELLSRLAGVGARVDVLAPGDARFDERDTLQILLQGPAASLGGALRTLGPALRRASAAPPVAVRPPPHDPAGFARRILQEHVRTAQPDPGPLTTHIALVSPFAGAAVRAALRSLVVRGTEPPAGLGRRPDGKGRRSAGADDRRPRTLPEPATRTADLRPGRQVLSLPNLVQGRLLIAIPGSGDPAPLRALAWILHHAYSGRLGVKAIAETGLAYSMNSEVATRGGMLAYFTVGAAPDSLPALESALADVLARAAASLSEEEIASFRSYARGSLPVRLSDPVQAAGVWLSALLHGEGHNGPRAAAERDGTVTLEEVAALARRSLDPARRLTVIVGRASSP